jgi:hypothetical protein
VRRPKRDRIKPFYPQVLFVFVGSPAPQGCGGNIRSTTWNKCPDSALTCGSCVAEHFKMQQPSQWPASIVPFGADQTLYVVIDRTGMSRSVAEIERTDFESIISDLLSGHFGDPVRVVAFNTLEHWSEDVSSEVAREIQTRSDIEGEILPEHLQDFVRQHQIQNRS